MISCLTIQSGYHSPYLQGAVFFLSRYHIYICFFKNDLAFCLPFNGTINVIVRYSFSRHGYKECNNLIEKISERFLLYDYV